MQTKHELGQYFTTNAELKEVVFKFILNNPDTILEPSVGQGDLVAYVMDKVPNIVFDMYEIDQSIPILDAVDKSNIIYGDFMIQPITKTYKTIIGNPPYVRTKTGNLYIDFIHKCYDLLDMEGGELIFIVPSEFLKLTSASKLLNIMMSNGNFTHIYHPHNEKLFKDAAIDVIVFRYCKSGGGMGASASANIKETLYNGVTHYITNSDGLITFDINPPTQNMVMLKELFNVYVGIVSGKEEVYKTELGNILVLNGANKLEKYIYITKFPCDDNKINQHLLKNKQLLIERKIRKFTEANWFEWGALRNIEAINQNKNNRKCIYIYNLTRAETIAFVGDVHYFGGGLIMLLPKTDGTDLHKVANYLNSEQFKHNFMFSGRFKIGHRQICNSYIPLSYCAADAPPP